MRTDRECGEIHGKNAAEDLALFRPLDQSAVSPAADIQASYMKHVLKLFDGNWSQASKALGVSANTLRKWVEET